MLEFSSSISFKAFYCLYRHQGDTDQAEVEDPHCRHDQHVGGAGDNDQDGEEGSGEGQSVKEAEQKQLLYY